MEILMPAADDRSLKIAPIAPSAFRWEDWYSAVGGRTINIAEVNAYLERIREDQNKRFDGPVSRSLHTFGSPEEAASHLKEKAADLGADIVGICEIEPTDVYQGRTVNEKYAIAVGQRMRWRAFQVVPSEESAIECLRIYYTLGEIVIQLADYTSGRLVIPVRSNIPLETVIFYTFLLV
jgi:hypothetical protein